MNVYMEMTGKPLHVVSGMERMRTHPQLVLGSRTKSRCGHTMFCLLLCEATKQTTERELVRGPQDEAEVPWQ